jgi:hypothetical protein
VSEDTQYSSLLRGSWSSSIKFSFKFQASLIKAPMDVKCDSKEDNSPWRGMALIAKWESSSSSRPSSQPSHGSAKKVWSHY